MSHQIAQDEPLSPTPFDVSNAQIVNTLNRAAELALADLELSPLTRRTYRYGMRALIRFLHLSRGDDEAAESLAPCSLDVLTEETLYHFNRWLREAYPDPREAAGAPLSGAPTRTARTYLVAAKRLMNWLDVHGLLPEGLSYDRLLRNRALLALLYDTGMRISEALALTREDILDGRSARLRLRHTKNGKPRTVFVSQETLALVRTYTSEREDGIYAPLFVSHGRNKGTSITASHAWLIVKQAARAEGLYDNTSPHSLRHRRAQDLLDEGMPLEWVAALLGHQHPDTTRVVYAWQTDEERLADMVSTYGLSPLEAQRRLGNSDES
jgi:integrase